ncbi:hypothetical protein BDV24DRAFT_144392, partial [Aspergillus arachidicola]
MLMRNFDFAWFLSISKALAREIHLSSQTLAVEYLPAMYHYILITTHMHQSPIVSAGMILSSIICKVQMHLQFSV